MVNISWCNIPARRIRPSRVLNVIKMVSAITIHTMGVHCVNVLSVRVRCCLINNGRIDRRILDSIIRHAFTKQVLLGGLSFELADSLL